MKIQHIIGVSVLTAIATSLLFFPVISRGERDVTQVSRETIWLTLTEPHLSSAQVIWLARLMSCESGIKASAVNPNDRDNTPSYGILQFKPSTFAFGARDAGIATTTPYMNPEAQVSIVTRWILKGGIDWHQQFPDCVLKLGLPPQNEPLTLR